ncbi:response regulator [Eubacteriaceae bacterium ES3]|nr:response regulator [Eubacteriaceae bacterium ES3]
MKSVKIMIVDDSTFSIGMLKKMLEKGGHEIIGTALDKKEAIEKAKQLQPELITMDMTLPDGNGIDCSREILKDNKDAKIIAISAMMDDEIVEQSKAAGILGYLQKPVDQELLDAEISRIFAGDELFTLIENNYQAAFSESIFSFLKHQIGGEISINTNQVDDSKMRKSMGVSVSVGIIGCHDGRFIIDMSETTAVSMTKQIMEAEETSIDDAIQFLSELANIISGNSCSLLNGLNRSLGLRVSPPTIIRGKDVRFAIGDMMNSSFQVGTDLGELFINIGFQKGDGVWM